MEEKEKQIREKIKTLVKEFWQAKQSAGKFVPGKTRVQYSGSMMDERELNEVVEATLNGWFGLGPKARAFETKLSEFIGVNSCLLTNSGSSSNLLAVAALTSPQLGEKRLKPGDEVITVACTFPTTLNPILQHGLVPVFLDVELGTYNLLAEKLGKAIGGKTKAIMFAHTLGNPHDMNEIMDFAKERGLYVIEDNCDALGSEVHGKKTGSFGHYSTLSFYPAHQITIGEGGAVVTNDRQLAKLAESFRNWGRACWCTGDERSPLGACGMRFAFKVDGVPYDHKYMYSNIGYNLKPTEINAAMGVPQMEKLPKFIEARRKNHAFLHSELQKFEDRLILHETFEGIGAKPSWFAYAITVREPSAGLTRDGLVKFLEAKNIETRPLFAGNILHQPAYQGIKCRVAEKLANSDKILRDTLMVGVYPGLDQEKLSYIADGIGEFMAKA
ncbi:UDP-4-amino-4-deoxy-L-arabinose--oxoglutarate aminotransferase [Candidatus Gugararchaeum adminiculabundum]|nr:UDP-4-amino-4-deoxy-L-arabinose--oxoglutarate aminotransferase [Candidatus Gugararchaeum adminiculabundum]